MFPDRPHESSVGDLELTVFNSCVHFSTDIYIIACHEESAIGTSLLVEEKNVDCSLFKKIGWCKITTLYVNYQWRKLSIIGILGIAFWSCFSSNRFLIIIQLKLSDN